MIHFKVRRHQSYPDIALVTLIPHLGSGEPLDRKERQELVADLEQLISELSFDFEEQE